MDAQNAFADSTSAAVHIYVFVHVSLAEWPDWSHVYHSHCQHCALRRDADLDDCTLQAVAALGLRAADWPEEVEGTYMRMDVPHIVPDLLTWLEGQKPGMHNIDHAAAL